jgi:hypothetical protein
MLVDAVRVVQVTMHYSAAMSKNCPDSDAKACRGAIRHGGVCDLLFLTLVFVILVRTGNAVAGEQVSIAGGPIKPDYNTRPAAGQESLASPASLFDLPHTYHAAEVGSGDASSPGDFRPRRPSLLQRESPDAAREDTPMPHDTSVWQRLAEYRAHGRVRLLTLWESGASSVSLQAGKKGEPSVQWTSRSMNRGGATRGVFDQLVSMAGASRGFHPAPHPSQAEAPPRPGKLPELGLGTNK